MLISFVRTVFLYMVLILLVRLMGKRQIGQLEPSEFVVTMVMADLATLPMQGKETPLWAGLVPMITILGMEMVCASLSMRSVRFRKILCGKPVILMENGKMLQDNMRKTRVTIDELTGHLRQKDVLDPRQVRYAILETDGNLSVFLRDDGALPITIISDGFVIADNLKKAGRDQRWVDKTLKKYKSSVEDTWLLTVDEDGQEIFYPKGK